MYAFKLPGSVIFSLLLVCIALGACNNSKQKVNTFDSTSIYIKLPAPSPLSKSETARLRTASENWYDSVLKKRGFNGGIVVAKKGNIVFEAYNGNVDNKPSTPNTDTTSFHIASISKTFTAMATLKLWQDGKINIDDEFSKYFPAFNYPGVTIRTLLNHRSGLPNYVHFLDNMGWNKKITATNDDVLNFLIEHKGEIQGVATPNTRFTYCNTNFALLALLIEKVTNEDYATYLQKTFLTPLQMKHTFVYDFSRDSGNVPLSMDGRGRTIALNFLDKVYGDKNVYSTPRDLLTWDRALTSGLIFNTKTLTEAYTPYSNEKPGIRNYGLGWRMNNFPTGKKMIYHNGWWHGNNAAFIRLLQDSATIIVLGNKENHGIYHAKDLAHLFGNYFGDEGEEETDPSIKPEVVTALADTTKTTLPTFVKPVKKMQQVKPAKKKAVPVTTKKVLPKSNKKGR